MPSTDVTVVAHPEAGALAFVVSGTPELTLVVWDKASDMHNPGEVWGLFTAGKALVAVDGKTAQIDALVFAARAHFGRALHVVAGQRGLSPVESQVLAAVGLVAA